MPFESKSQLRTCYSKQAKGSKWDCDRSLKETPSICCLPERKGMPVKSRCLKGGEKKVGKVQTGPRGGKFFVIKERNREGKMCVVKVYLPRS